MKTGIELVSLERWEQQFKHNRTVESDIKENTAHQLSQAASILCVHEDNFGCNELEDFVEDYCPTGWDESIWRKMLEKPHKERCIIAAALLTAQVDVYQFLESNHPEPGVIGQ